MESNYSNYYGLIFNCPVGIETEDCQFKSIRQFPLKDKLNYYNAMTEAEKMIMIRKHKHCLSVREKKTLFHESQ
jgi:hypothetical protein